MIKKNMLKTKPTFDAEKNTFFSTLEHFGRFWMGVLAMPGGKGEQIPDYT